MGSFAWYDIPEASDGKEEQGFDIEMIEPSARPRGGRGETFFFSVYCSLGPYASYDIPETSDGEEERGIGIERITASRIKTSTTSIRKIKSPLAPLSVAPLRSLAEASGAADPLQPKYHTLWKTCSSCNTFSRTPLPATTLATSVVAPVTVVPSVVRTLRLSLLHSH